MSSTEKRAKLSYQIEKKPEGGFVALASDSKLPSLEASTREEIQNKIQAALVPFVQQIAPEADRIELEVLVRKPGASSFAELFDLSRPVSKPVIMLAAAFIVLFVILYVLFH